MATNDISKHFKTVKKLGNGGSQKDLIVSDSQFASYASGTIVENVDSGQQYSKNASFTNVYDKISSFNDYLLPTALSVAINGAIGNAITSLSYTSTSGKGQFKYTMDDFIKNAEFKTSASNTLTDDYGISTLTWNTKTKTLNGNRTKYVQPSKVNVTTSGSGNAVTVGQWKQNSDGTYSVDLVKGESFSKPSNTKIAYSGSGNAITSATWAANSDGTSTLTFNKGETFLRLSELNYYMYANLYTVLSVNPYNRGGTYSASELRGGSGYGVIESAVPASGSYYCISSINIDQYDMGVVNASHLGCSGGGYYNRRLSMFVKTY